MGGGRLYMNTKKICKTLYMLYAQEPTNIRRKHTRVYTLHNTTPLINIRNNASWSVVPSSGPCIGGLRGPIAAFARSA